MCPAALCISLFEYVPRCPMQSSNALRDACGDAVMACLAVGSSGLIKQVSRFLCRACAMRLKRFVIPGSRLGRRTGAPGLVAGLFCRLLQLIRQTCLITVISEIGKLRAMTSGEVVCDLHVQSTAV